MALPLILTLLLVDMFDNIGTLIGVTKRAGLLDPTARCRERGACWSPIPWPRSSARCSAPPRW